MAKVFRINKEIRTPNGQRVPMLDADGQPVKLEKWRAIINLWTGKRKMVTLVKSRVESQRQADLLQGQQDAIRKGLAPPPTSTAKAAQREYDNVAEEYLAWGNVQGGRGGRPWSKDNAKKRRYYMDWWRDALRVETLADLDGSLPRAEKALRALAEQGRAGKTLALYREGLFSFCLWCVERRYLPDNPFRAMAKFDTTPRVLRRDMTLDEIGRLLAIAPLYRSLLYAVNFATGFRASELRSLSVTSLDRERGGLRLSAEADKGRKERFQPLAPELVARLMAFAESGVARELYTAFFARAGKAISKGIPETPLLYVPAHPARTIKADLEAAGIPLVTSEGRLDFHACRVAYINLVIGTGADVKTTQTLARHSHSSLTLGVYARTKDERLARAADEVGRIITDAQRQAHNQVSTKPAENME